MGKGKQNVSKYINGYIRQLITKLEQTIKLVIQFLVLTYLKDQSK